MKRVSIGVTRVVGYLHLVLNIGGWSWRAYPFGLIASMIAELAQGLLPIANAWIMKVVFDRLVQLLDGPPTESVPSEFLLLLGFQGILAIIGQATGFVGNFLTNELTRRITHTTQIAVHEKVNSLNGLAPFEDPKFHDMVQLASKGAQMGPARSVRIFAGMLRATITIVAFISILLMFNPVLAVMISLGAVPQLYYQVKVGHQRFAVASISSSKIRWAAYLSHVLSSNQFAKELRLFGLAQFFIRRLDTTHSEINRAERNQQIRELRWQVALAAIVNLTSASAFVVIVLQASQGALSVGDVILYAAALTSTQAALLNLTMSVSGLNESVLFFSRFTELTSLPQPLSIAVNAEPVKPLTGCIEFRNVSFRYSDEQPWVLKNLSFIIPAGNCLALVGRNGAGKTTLVKLLTRLYDPTEGQILWDGVDLQSLDLEGLRNHISVVFQDFMRYELPVYENIGLGDVNGINDLIGIELSARAVGLHEAIIHLPHGYQTLLSRSLRGEEVGVDLSVGEWQKLALARMFMRKADMLILDEPTAALDAQSEEEINRLFVQIMVGRTSLLITHRLSSVQMADLIAVLEDGQITEYGPHLDLLAREGEYSRLYRLQADRYR